MKKAYFLTLILFFLSINTYADTITWDYFNRTGWYQLPIWDGDEYGNTEVWNYLYANKYTNNENNFVQITSYGSVEYSQSMVGNRDNVYPYIKYETANSIRFHPEDNYSIILQYQSPLGASFEVNAGFRLNSSSADGVNVYFQKNNDQNYLFSTTINAGQSVNANFNVELLTGDSIYLIVNPRSNESYDQLILTSYTLEGTTANPIPEPMTLIMLGLSVLACFRKINMGNNA